MIAAHLAPDAGYEAWRDKARFLLTHRTPPEQVIWQSESAPDLFGDAAADVAAPASITVPRAFVEIAETAVLHNDPARFALLYRVLWRLQGTRGLMEDAADPDVAKLLAMAKSVRRDEHKMHAFLRFREVADDEGVRYLAWFEPQHHILERAAEFFVRRFAGMRWSIVTPQGSAHWDGETLRFGPAGLRTDVPADDARDEDWRAYYEHMFNPARLKVAAMKREMPKRYWANMPESSTIASLIRVAGSSTEAMVEAEPTTPKTRAGAAHARIAPAAPSAEFIAIADRRAAPESIAALTAGLRNCRACPLWRDATQTVPGEGAIDRPLLALVGEQPGDQEDLAGRPFVGPAGQVLDRALAEAGIDRTALYVTNAVKHFKHEPRGKRRLHKRPNAGEVELCRWWLTSELALVKPKLTIALGATALASLSGYSGALNAARGTALTTREGGALRATVHPSYLLRLPDEAQREAAFTKFVADLREAHAIATTMT